MRCAPHPFHRKEPVLNVILALIDCALLGVLVAILFDL